MARITDSTTHCPPARLSQPAMPHSTLLLALLAACTAGLGASAAAAAAGPGLSGLLDRAAALEPWLVSTRRTLHQFPELYWQEANTSAYIRRTLDDLGIPYK